jgi:hypothetical protein
MQSRLIRYIKLYQFPKEGKLLCEKNELEDASHYKGGLYSRTFIHYEYLKLKIMPSSRDLLYREIQEVNLETQIKSSEETEWLNGLPLIICGPILRRVDYKSVSVWLAFKEKISDIKLDVFEMANTKIINTKAPSLSGTVTTPFMLGKCLFVTLVTAKSDSPKLRSDVIYGYNISFTHNGIRKQLDYKGVLKDGLKSISYAPYLYPTFCLPSDNTDNLKIVHGSCRKPHGGKTDALRALDAMIEINVIKAAERPQLLCLTGDQIYADDVSDLILYKINKAKCLFGWDETLPKKYTENQLKPGNRKNIIAKSGNKTTWLRRLFPLGGATKEITPDDLTTTDAESHLIYLSEFLLMYLFTFSDTFLSTTGWPKIEDLYKLSSDPEERQNKTASFNKQKEHLNNFVACLRFVKKALANISTLMIFDDHDITDDWFITKSWSKAALAKGTTSRRYILNGLLAYSVFQDWGNDYTKYNSGAGLEILKALELNNSDNYPNRCTEFLSDTLLPVLSNDTIAKKKFSCLKNKFKWDYRIDYNSFILLALNTRTERCYYDKEHPIGGLSRSGNLTNGSFDGNKLLVLVSAAPVFGNIPMEIRQEQVRAGTTDLVTMIASRVENLIGMYEKDQEAWAFSGEGFRQLLLMISLFDKVLILSGDVHYAFTAYIRLWKKIEDKYRLTQIVQSTSSALKNSSDQTHYPAIDKYGLRPSVDHLYKRVQVLSFTRPGQNEEMRDNPTFQDPQEYNPQRTRIKIKNVKINPSLQYSVQFIKSTEQDHFAPLFQSIRRTEQIKYFPDHDMDSSTSHIVCGKDNISMVSFTKNSITNSIWFANGTEKGSDSRESQKMVFPFIKHIVKFNSQFTAADLPSSEFKKIREALQ